MQNTSFQLLCILCQFKARTLILFLISECGNLQLRLLCQQSTYTMPRRAAVLQTENSENFHANGENHFSKLKTPISLIFVI